MSTFEEFHRAFRTRLRMLRERRQLLQADLDELGIAQSTLQQIEQGTRLPRIDTLHRLAACYGMTLSELLDVRHVPTRSIAVRRGGYRPGGKPVTGFEEKPRGRSTGRSGGRR